MKRISMGRTPAHYRGFGREGTSEELAQLLKDSPLPWTLEMLQEWFGWRTNSLVTNALGMMRIRKVAHGLYTCPVKASRREKVIVTDEMLSRYGFNL